MNKRLTSVAISRATLKRMLGSPLMATGRVLEGAGLDAQAATLFTGAAATGHHVAHFRLGHTRRKQRRWAAAADAFRKAAELSGDSEAWMWLGYCQIKRGRLDEGQKALDTAAEKGCADPRLERFMQLRGDGAGATRKTARPRPGRRRPRITEFLKVPKAPKIDPGDPERFWSRSDATIAADLLAMVKHRQVATFVATVAACGPDARSPRRDRVVALCRARMFEANSCFREAAEEAALALESDGSIEFPDDLMGEALKTRGRVLARLGAYAEMRACIDRLLTLQPDDPAAAREAARMLWVADPDRARALIERAATRSRRGPPWGEFLLAELATRGLDYAGVAATLKSLASGGGHADFPLLLANAAGREGLEAERLAHVAAYFAQYGLDLPMRDRWSAFCFEALTPTPALPDRAPERPLVSVVVTVFNAEATLARSLASLQAQSLRDIEILVVDDRSADGSLALAQRIAATDPRIRVLANDRNVGTYVAKNRALAEAHGQWLTFHDADDWAHPERLAAHVAVMLANPLLVAVRSHWVRMTEDGVFMLRRTNPRFLHANPASVFLRRDALGEVGFFDAVRTGADSEFWFRLRAVYGPEQIATIEAPLGIGLTREGSLTSGGVAAMNEENYSPVRSAYQRAWFDWHLTPKPREAWRLPPAQPERRFAAPAEIVETGSPGARETTAPPAAAAAGPVVLFGVSLASRRVVADFGQTSRLLGATLRSILAQSNPDFRVIVCGHERPVLPEFADPRVEFMTCDFAPPKDPTGFRRDKMRKRTIIGARLRSLGGGYFFPLDADDLVHRDLVAHVRADDNRRGYLITDGYALDLSNRRVAPVPGAWRMPFDRVCGSSALLWFDPTDLPSVYEAEENKDASLFSLFREHAYWPVTAEELGRPLDPVPFPAGVYVVNHRQNLSFQMQRKADRQQRIIDSIARNRLPDVDFLAREFALSLEGEGGAL